MKGCKICVHLPLPLPCVSSFLPVKPFVNSLPCLFVPREFMSMYEDSCVNVFCTRSSRVV